MGYKQIDGTKQVLVHENGRLRLGLRNLPEDSDRILRNYDDEGNPKNEWPRVVVAINPEGKDDIRLLPEIVLKEHGRLPRKAQCEPEDFESQSGEKWRMTDSSVENVEYVGEASLAKKPYKGDPKKDDSGDPDSQASATATAPEPEAPETEKPKVKDEPTPLMKGSGELTAKEAISVIRNFEYEELADAGFYTEEQREGGKRVTVEEAWKSKKSEASE